MRFVIMLLAIAAATPTMAAPLAKGMPRQNHICSIEEVRVKEGRFTVEFAEGRRVRRQRGEAAVEFVIDKGELGDHLDQNGAHHVRAVPAMLGDKIIRADTMPEDYCAITIVIQNGVMGAAGEAATYSHIGGQQSYKEFIPATVTP